MNLTSPGSQERRKWRRLLSKVDKIQIDFTVIAAQQK